MKILMVISQFDPIIGGSERQAQLLAKKLVEKGVRIQIVTGWWNLKTPRKEVVAGIEVFRNFSAWGIFGMDRHRTIRVLRGITYAISLATFLSLHGRGYDIIHVHQLLYPAFVALLIGKKILKKPVLVKSASSGLTSDIKQLRRLPFGLFQLNFLLKELNYLVAISRATGKDFKEIGYSEARISYIPNGVEVPVQAKIAYNQVIQIITVTRLSQEKGVDVLLRAWAEVLKEEKALKLIIVGYGSLEYHLKNLSLSLGIAKSVDFVGMIQDASEYLKASDLFVLSSRAEGMSNALLEAMSYGVPCIATRVGGNSELLGAKENAILPGGYLLAKNGLLVNPDDAIGLSEAIVYFIRNEKAREKMGRAARKFIQENYSIDLIAERYIDLYQSVLAER